MNTLNNHTDAQINQIISLLGSIFSENLIGVYLYGSSVLGGLQRYSDIALLAVTNHHSSLE